MHWGAYFFLFNNQNTLHTKLLLLLCFITKKLIEKQFYEKQLAKSVNFAKCISLNEWFCRNEIR